MLNCTAILSPPSCPEAAPGAHTPAQSYNTKGNIMKVILRVEKFLADCGYRSLCFTLLLSSLQADGQFLAQLNDIGHGHHVLLMAGNFANVDVPGQHAFPAEHLVDLLPLQLLGGAEQDDVSGIGTRHVLMERPLVFDSQDFENV